MSAPTDVDRAFVGYQSAVDRFDAAIKSGRVVSARTYRIAGWRVRVRVVGHRLAEAFGQPWRHLSDSGEGAEDVGGGALHVDLWDSLDTGIEAPSEIVAIDPLSRFPFQTSRNDRYVAVRQPETAVWLDRQAGRLVGAVGDVERRALYEAGRPLETPLLIWLRDRGVPLVHASFVAQRGRGALILGKSGSGKSTFAAACLCAGFDFLSDDKVGMTEGREGQEGREGRRSFAHSLNSSLHVDAGTLARLPALSAHAVAPLLSLDDKHRVDVERLFPGRARASAPVHVLVIPSLQAEPGSRIVPASRREAFLALSLSTVLSLPIARANSLDPLARLAEHTPAFKVDLNPVESAPARVARVLDAQSDFVP